MLVAAYIAVVQLHAFSGGAWTISHPQLWRSGNSRLAQVIEITGSTMTRSRRSPTNRGPPLETHDLTSSPSPYSPAEDRDDESNHVCTREDMARTYCAPDRDHGSRRRRAPREAP